jgi:hypothetical protein
MLRKPGRAHEEYPILSDWVDFSVLNGNMPPLKKICLKMLPLSKKNTGKC